MVETVRPAEVGRSHPASSAIVRRPARETAEGAANGHFTSVNGPVWPYLERPGYHGATT